MLTDTVRPQTDAEAWQFRNRVEALTQSIEEAKPETRLAACACMIVFALLLVAGAIALKSPLWWLEGTTPILIALVVFNLAIAYSPKSRYERLVEPFRKQTAEDAETGKVRSIRVQAVRVLVRQWPLDGIHCLIFDGGKGRYLAVVGQQFPETHRFPSTDIEILLGTRHGTLLTVLHRGKKFESVEYVSSEDIPLGPLPDQPFTVFEAAENATVAQLIGTISVDTYRPAQTTMLASQERS